MFVSHVNVNQVLKNYMKFRSELFLIKLLLIVCMMDIFIAAIKVFIFI